MSDGELLARMVVARRRLIQAKNDLALAKGRLKQTDAAKEVDRLRRDVLFCQDDLAMVLGEIDDVYQPALMAVPGRSVTISYGGESVTLGDAADVAEPQDEPENGNGVTGA